VSRRLSRRLVTAGFLGPVLAAAPAHDLPLDQAADGYGIMAQRKEGVKVALSSCPAPTE